MPSASNDELMVLAVYMPPQEPDARDGAALDLAEVRLAHAAADVNWPTASNTLTMLRSLPL